MWAARWFIVCWGVLLWMVVVNVCVVSGGGFVRRLGQYVVCWSCGWVDWAFVVLFVGVVLCGCLLCFRGLCLVVIYCFCGVC